MSEYVTVTGNHLLDDTRIDLAFEHWCHEHAREQGGNWREARDLSYGLRLVGKRMLRAIREEREPTMGVTEAAHARGILPHHPPLVFEQLVGILARHRDRALDDVQALPSALPGSVAAALEALEAGA